jgi:hypothetical protein
MRKRLRKFGWAHGLMVLLASVGTVVAAPVPASAAPCGGSCVGAYAAASDCTNDEQAVADETEPTGIVVYKVFYSPSCHTAWAEASTTDGSGAQGIGVLQLWVISPTGGVETHVDHQPFDDYTSPTVDTPMVSWDDSVKVCANEIAYPGTSETIDDDPNPADTSGWGNPGLPTYTGGCINMRWVAVATVAVFSGHPPVERESQARRLGC